MAHKLNVVVAEDHPLYRKAIVAILRDLDYIDNIYEAENGHLALKHLAIAEVDFVLLDINMPEMDGIDALTFIRKTYPNLKVIVLTQFGDRKVFRTIMALGANGYLLKSSTEDAIIEALHMVLFADEMVVDEEVEQRDHSSDLLTDREKEVLSLICRQQSSEAIAELFDISVHTVANHRKAIMKKTRSNSLAGMIKWAFDNGVV